MRNRLNRSRRLALAIGGAVALVGVLSLGASATHSFLDVPEDHIFHGDIEWMKEADVTRGCNPPANTEYCPEEFTTRGQMAAFFHRFSNSGVLNAGTLDGKDSTEFLGVDDKAADSDLLDGLDSTDFVQVGDQASDSDTLDGKDSSEFLSADVYTVETTEGWLLAVANVTTAECNAGDLLLAGGHETGGLLSLNVTDSYPDGNSWTVEGTATLLGDVTVHAVCVATG